MRSNPFGLEGCIPTMRGEAPGSRSAGYPLARSVASLWPSRSGGSLSEQIRAGLGELHIDARFMPGQPAVADRALKPGLVFVTSPTCVVRIVTRRGASQSDDERQGRRAQLDKCDNEQTRKQQQKAGGN